LSSLGDCISRRLPETAGREGVRGQVSKGQSVYLDLLRVAAALTVFGVHVCYPQFAGRTMALPPYLSHGAVIVFFVLSGFVISHVAATRERDWRDFLASRAARIYSVAVPALLLTWAIDRLLLGHGIDAHIPLYQHQAPWKYLPVFLSFTTDFWFLAESAFSNLPYWSLCYEVWYYLAFAALVFLTGWRRVLAVGAVALLVGPRLWLLFPIWLTGWGVQALGPRLAVGKGAARAVLLLTGALIVAAVCTDHAVRFDAWLDASTGGWIGEELRYSRYFATDLLLGLVIGAHLWAARHAELAFGVLARPIGIAASVSFTLYLTHFPLLALCSFLFGPSILPALLATLAAVWLLGQLTERQKPALQRWLRRRLA
jgi:peptidoglycan/LPS O-acetylase OafA/YrhL